MIQRRYSTYFGAACLLLTASCAQIVTPGGGKKDVRPPFVEKYVPDSAATGFSARTITLLFDEYIQLQDLQKEFTVSPPMSRLPEVTAKGKMLRIDLPDSLRANTTYVLSFGSSIRDYTESNAMKDFRYIFSTGTYIDTLRLTGMVKNAYDQKTEKGVLVMLYEANDDSLPYKSVPSYFAKTNADGSYKISNIKPGKYKAFALKDANSNYLYDVPSETIAFSDTLIKIARHTKLDMILFKEQPKKQLLLKNFSSGYARLSLYYALPVSKLSYQPLNTRTNTTSFLTEYNAGRDSITVWFPTFPDTLHFKVMADGITADTIRMSTGSFRKDGGGRGDGLKLMGKLNAQKDKLFDLGSTVILTLNHPINKYEETKIIFKKNGEQQFMPLHESGINDKIKRTFYIDDFSSTLSMKDSIGKDLLDSTGNKMFFPEFELLDTGAYSVFIPPGTFTDIFGLQNDTIKTDFKTQEEKYYGTFKLTLKMKYRLPHIVELVNEKGVVYNYISSEKSIFSYEYLPPGAYKLRVIYDQDGNGKWSTGNYLEKKKPETIIYHPNPVTIRSNWDLELDWKLE